MYAIDITQLYWYFLLKPNGMLRRQIPLTQFRLHLLEENAGCQNLDLENKKGTHQFLFPAPYTARSAILSHYDFTIHLFTTITYVTI